MKNEFLETQSYKVAKMFSQNIGFPQLIEDFKSLEGEGVGLGLTSLFVRVNKCNFSCKFCDTSFSIPGNDKVVIRHNNQPVDSKERLFEYLQDKYSYTEKNSIKNLTITGGEPLLNIDNLEEFINTILSVFKNIERIIIETNGSLLLLEENCFKLIKSIGNLDPKINLFLSISPKLKNSISHGYKFSADESITDMYIKVFENYRKYLDKHFDIQIKFIHHENMEENNLRLIRGITKNLKFPIDRDKILIMPFTPPDPIDRDKDLWSQSKDNAANFAAEHFFRYSPRIHIDRRLK